MGRPPTSPPSLSSTMPWSGSNNDNSINTTALTSTPPSDLSKEAKVEQINEKIAYLSREIEKVTTTSSLIYGPNNEQRSPVLLPPWISTSFQLISSHFISTISHLHLLPPTTTTHLTTTHNHNHNNHNNNNYYHNRHWRCRTVEQSLPFWRYPISYILPLTWYPIPYILPLTLIHLIGLCYGFLLLVYIITKRILRWKLC